MIYVVQAMKGKVFELQFGSEFTVGRIQSSEAISSKLA